MRFEAADLRVGLLVFGGVLMLFAAFLWLSPALARSTQPLYTEFTRIDGIAEQTPVQMRGFTVGRVTGIEPRLNDAGALVFRVRMQIDWRLRGGGTLPLTVGTRARMIPSPVPLGNGFISLEPAVGPDLARLEPGALIPGERVEATMDQMQALAAEVRNELGRTLTATRVLIDTLVRAAAMTREAAGSTQSAAAITAEALPRLFASVDETLATADSTIGSADRLFRDMQQLMPATVAMLDSMSLLLADVRRTAHEASQLVTAPQPQLTRILGHLDTTTALFQHFVAQVSRRPARMLTGVRPPEWLTAPPSAPAAAQQAGCVTGRPCPDSAFAARQSPGSP